MERETELWELKAPHAYPICKSPIGASQINENGWKGNNAPARRLKIQILMV